MEQQVKVISVNRDGTAQVLHTRLSACSGDCHKCSGCGAVQQKMQLTARNPIGACPGDTVIIRTQSRSVLLAAGMLYMLPLVLFFAGCIAGALLWGAPVLTGGIAFVAGIVLAVVYDRCVAGKKEPEYTIVGFVNT